MAEKSADREGRLLSRPTGTRTGAEAPAGLRPLGQGGARDGYLYVPPDSGNARPSPLVVVLHGAGEDARDGLAQLRGQADGAGIMLLALSSRGPTWDFVIGGYGPDVAAIDRALGWTFSRYAVDLGRLGIGGYSDGASYALSLALSNGDLFTHVLAFSPGFVAPTGRVGSPRIFVSHGTRDRWLPIERCSRRIVPQLERAGYEVLYREFEGPHVVPPRIGQEAAAWFATGPNSSPPLR